MRGGERQRGERMTGEGSETEGRKGRGEGNFIAIYKKRNIPTSKYSGHLFILVKNIC